MLRAEQEKNGVSDAGRISGVVVMACIILCWQRAAFSAETPPEESPHLQLAPIYVSNSVDGIIMYDYLNAKYAASSTRRQSLAMRVNGHVNVRSFFWQPWLAQVSSSLNAGVGKSLTRFDSEPINSSLSTLYTGDAALNLVKYSRFPFLARVFREDNRLSSGYSGGNYDSVRTGYSLDQVYKAKGGNFIASANFISTKQDGSTSIGPIYSDLFTFNTRMTPARFNSILISGNTNRQNQPIQGQSITNDNLLVSHLYQPNMSFSVASIVNTSKASSTLVQGSNPGQVYDASLQQFSSLVSIRPQRSPLTVTGSVRYFGADRSTNGISSPEVKFSNFDLGANYLFSPLVRLYGSVDVTDSNGTQTIYTNTALAASKPFKFKSTTGVGGYRYTGSAGGTIYNNNLNTTNFAGQSTSTNALGVKIYLSHALDKSNELGGGKLAKKLYQTITMGFVNNASAISSLNTGGSLTWNRIQGRESTMLRLTALDSRSVRGAPFVFQMVNLQASRSQSMSRNESLTGSLTVQGTHMESNVPSPLVTIAPSAEIGYFNQRVFRVRNLTFKSMLHISDTNIAPTQIQSYENQATRSWENNFEYKIGLLAMTLTAKAARIQNSSQSLLLYSMSRSF